MAAGVWIGDGAWTRSAGYADLAAQTPFDPAGHVRIASITKSYTATAVLQQVDKGALALTDTLESFVPGVANGAQITVQNLLAMTSGIYDFTSDDAFLAAFDADPTMPWSDQQMLEVIARHEPLFAPGAKVSYCDSNYGLLGMILQKVTGKPAGEVITSEVIGKLALPNTSYPTTTAIPDPHPTGYVPPVTDPNARVRQCRRTAEDRHRVESGRAVDRRGDDLHARRPAGLGERDRDRDRCWTRRRRRKG